MGLVALRHVESFQARDGTHVPWLVGRFLSTVPPGKPLSQFSDFIQWGRTSRIILSNSSDGKHPRFVPDINEIASRISSGSYLLIFYLQLLELYSGFLYLFASEIGPYISFSCITVRFGISYPIFISKIGKSYLFLFPKTVRSIYLSSTRTQWHILITQDHHC